MPRLEFNSWRDFEKWLKIQIRKYGKSYKLYITDREEVIVVPATSTKPTEYGYYIFEDEKDEDIRKKDFDTLVRALATELKLDYFEVHEFVWNAEREPRIRSEEEQ